MRCVTGVGGLKREKSPSAWWQISICYAKPVVCFDHFPDVGKMIISIILVEFRCFGIASLREAFPNLGMLQRRKSLMLRISFFVSPLSASKASFRSSE